jgi:hypothetical protein
MIWFAHVNSLNEDIFTTKICECSYLHSREQKALGIVRYSRVYLHTFGIFLVERRSQRKTLHINVVVMLLSA